MLADVTYDFVTLASPVLALVVGAVGAGTWARFRERKEDRNEVQALKDTVYGRKASIFERHPPLGLEDQVAALEAKVTEHTVLFATLVDKVTPNGGTTREIGDLILRIAQKLDIDIPEKTHGEDS